MLEDTLKPFKKIMLFLVYKQDLFAQIYCGQFEQGGDGFYRGFYPFKRVAWGALTKAVFSRPTIRRRLTIKNV